MEEFPALGGRPIIKLHKPLCPVYSYYSLVVSYHLGRLRG